MANKLYEESCIQDIAAAIREKNGSNNTYTVAQMGAAILQIPTEELIQHADIPDYVKTEVQEIFKKVESVRQDNSIVFLAMSDSHYYGAQADAVTNPNTDNVQSTTSNLHGAMAAKILAYGMNFDFMAHLGDMSFGHSTTTPALLQGQIKDLGDLLQEAHASVPCFHAIGNHDTGIYYHNEMIDSGETGVYTETGAYLYNAFTALSASDDTVFGDSANGGYCYRDFIDKKLRVFLLNTSEKLVNEQTDQGTYGAQRVWFANALLDLNSKTDATEWSFLVLSHYPADYGSNMPLSELLKAYVEGNSFTIKDPVTSYFVGDGTNETVDFSGKNGAKFIAQFHGHIHNFKVSKLYSYATGSGIQYNAQRICIPNGQYNRENYYSTVGSYTDIDFSEKTSYPKTIDTANDTSFVVNVINPSEQKIYSFCYGAGYDRVIGYGTTVYYSITTNLTNATISNDSVSVEEGQPYSATVIVDDGYELAHVAVIMDGEDVTADYVTDEKIQIDAVTGNVIITAVAVTGTNYTNQIPISTGTDGNIYNGKGYKENTYLSSGNDGTRSGIYAVGYIPAKKGDVIRLKNVGYKSGDTNSRLALYGSDRTMITNAQFGGNTIATVFPDAQFDSNGYLTQFTMTHVYCNNMAYFRLCANYIGDDSVITVNEVIDDEIQTDSETTTNSWNQIPTLVKDFLDNVTYDSNDYTTSQIASYAPATADINNTYPVGKTIKMVDGVLDRNGYEIAVSNGNTVLYNDIPNQYTEYVNRNNGTVLQVGTLKPTGALRQIKCATFNVRDLGGWACDGGTVKYGMLFRGGEFQSVDTDIFVNQLGIRHELNLRGTTEAEGEPTALRNFIGFTCPEQYVWYTIADRYKETWKEILRCAFDCVTKNKPLYFHCSAGADRTGTVACILEAILGMSQSDIDKDYELTCFASGTGTENDARRRNESEWSSLINEVNALTGTTFRDKVIGWVATLGFTADEINAYRTAMIDGTPDTITLDIDTYSVTNSIGGVETDNTTITAVQYQPYEAELTAPDGYAIGNVKITMGGVDVTALVFNGYKTTLNRKVVKNLTNCSLDNEKGIVIDGQGYVANLTADGGFTFEGGTVTITMGGVDVAAYYSNGKIAIPNVTGDIVITAEAVESAQETVPVTIITGYRCNYTVGQAIGVTEGSAYAISEEISVEYGKTYTTEYYANASDFGMYFVGYNDSGIVTEHQIYQSQAPGNFTAVWTPTVATTTKLRLRGYASSLPTANITELVVT